MDRRTADEMLARAELVPALEGALAATRELEAAMLANDIPARLSKPPAGACCGGGCSGANLQVLVRADDLPRVRELLRRRWLEAVAREGLDPNIVEPSGELDEAAGCPACGFDGARVDGACGDCGLQLE